MKISPYLEERAKQAQAVFDFLVACSPPVCAGAPSAAVEEGGALQEALEYRRTVFANSEIADGGQGADERIFANIFDLLLAMEIIGHDTQGSWRIYRGHYDSRWQLLPSYFRSVPPRADHLAATVRQGQLAYLRKKHERVDFDSLTPLQQDAVIQHYLSGTRLLDFTKSVYVAAYFATRGQPAPPDAPDMGAIYRVSPHDLQENLGIAMVEYPELPPEFLRIHRQQGLFVESDWWRVMGEPALFDRWVFYQTRAGLGFECEPLGVTAARLEPAEIPRGPLYA